MWGRQYESTAVKKYLAIKNPPGSSNAVTVEKCGFIIHPEHCWLGASPDRKVKDLNSDQPDGILEIKCPYSKRDVEPEEACKDPAFYCEIQDSRICLKSSHTYYHQVQLQLFVGSDMYGWCDFCIFTCKGLAVTRIFPGVSIHWTGLLDWNTGLDYWTGKFYEKNFKITAQTKI